jgi:glycosyltransferase involved in cell wall biosynthesis
MTVKLSVCIVAYNRAALLDRSLATLAAQTRPPDELVISDDCSPDDTPAVAEKWRSAFPRFVYNRNPENLSMPGNLNVAIGLTTGTYVANLHDGDLYAPTLLEKWEAALDAHPSAGFVFCGIAGWHVEKDSDHGVILHDVAPLTPGRTFFERYFLHRYASIVWGTVMARRAAYDVLLPFDPQFAFVSDVDMWMRMCARFDVAYVREPLITLDHTPSPWRAPGVFNWSSLETIRRMQLVNIQRFFAEDVSRRERELRRHARAVQAVWARRLLGRLWHRDWKGFFHGVDLARNLPAPLRWLGAARG